MDEKELRQTVLEVLKGRMEAQKISASDIDDDVSLVDLGVLDSFGFLELVNEIEEKIGIFPDFSEADPDEFTSINGLVKLLHASD